VSTAIVPVAPADMQHEAGSILSVIARAAADPSVNVDKLERLLAIQQTIIADQRRTSYMASMARLQAVLPQITKSGAIMDGLTVRSTYAKIEDIDVAVRPLCTAEGFSFSLDSRPTSGGTEYTSTMSHRDGHSETRTLLLPPATGRGCSPAQSTGANLSYARRYLLIMHLNLVTRDVDNDGQGESRPITAAQVDELRAALIDAGKSEARFLLWLKVGSLEELAADKYGPALMAVSEKKAAHK
jgi:hypothetical protein